MEAVGGKAESKATCLPSKPIFKANLWNTKKLIFHVYFPVIGRKSHWVQKGFLSAVAVKTLPA